MDRRTISMLAMCLLFMLAYPFVLQKFYPQYGHETKSAPTAKTQGASAPAATPGAPAAAQTAELLPDSDNVVFADGNVNLVFNKKSGSIKEISFPKYTDSETHKPLRIFSSQEAHNTATYVQVSEKDAVLDFASFAVRPGKDSVEAVSKSGDIQLTKQYSFSGSGRYDGKFSLIFENNSDAVKEISYQLMVAPSFPPRHTVDSQYIEANFFQSNGDNKTLKHLKAPKPDKWVDSPGHLTWLAVKDRHFSVIVKPETEQFSGRVTGFKNHIFNAALLSPKFTIPAHGRVRQDFVLYIGPNILDELSAAGLDELVNFGKFDMIAKALVGALELLHKVFRNYGLSIIMLTLLINVFLFPFTRNSLMSMKRMQLIQPQMTKLREQHKNNAEKLHKEMMELYKKHKVNPFGGCLPMFLQMPVFMALYVAISKSVILINSKLLWIKDLSSPDKIYLPVALPVLGKEIHVLPLIMMVAMIIQQKFTQIKIEGQDPQIESQQKMMAFTMPLVFVFIFYSMPSGLVLYWLTNTIIMSLYQWHLKKVTLA